MSNAAVDIEKLTTAERLDLIEQLWESLADRPLELTPEERSELLRRSRELDADIAAGRSLGRPWSEVLARLADKS
jgi:putative addiction module component (TIGR02574 family)